MRIEYIDPKTGKKTSQKIVKGMSLGRKGSDIVIPDSKISSKHAEIREEDGKLLLVDLGSTNKILYKGAKVESLELYNGVEFQLGSVYVTVIGRPGDVTESVNIPLEDMAGAETNVTGLIEDTKEKTHWSETIKHSLKDLLEAAEQKDENVYPFSKDLYLTIKEGPQKNRHIQVLYGPRSIGNMKQDICILDWNIGDVSFQLVEHDKNIYLTTDFPEEVLVNDSSSGTTKLNQGDFIKLGESILEVEIKSYE